MSFIHEEIMFKSNNHTLAGDLLFPTSKKFSPPYPSVVYFHGFPGNANKLAGIGMSLVRRGYAYFAFDFQGIRLSEGVFSLAGEIQNANDALDFLKSQNIVKIDPKRIGIYGESLGGAIAICIAAMRGEIQLTVTRAPVYDTHEFLSFPWLPETFRTMDIFMPGEVRGLDKPGKLEELKKEVQEAKFNPMEVIHTISPRKVFILASGQDELIPLQGVRKLFNKARKPRILKIQPFADHNLSSPEFFQNAVEVIVNWFCEHL